MMIKRVFSVFFTIFTLLSLNSAAGAASLRLPELSKCRQIFAYSGSSHAYFFGCGSNTLVSARVLPDAVTRSAQINGVIRAVCHDEHNAYALYESGRRQYGVATLNMDNGSCTTGILPLSQELITTSFAASDGEWFVMSAGAAYVYVLGICGDKTVRYELPSGAERLFVNGGSAYAVTFQGGIYRLGQGQTAFCMQLSPHTDFVNAGDGYLQTAAGELYALSGAKEALQNSAAVKTKRGIFAAREAVTAVAGTEETAAALYSDYRYALFPIGETAPEATQVNQPSGLDRIRPGVTVAQLKELFPEICAVFDESGNEVSNGNVRTGYTAELASGHITLAVTGDLNGSGTVNSADIKRLMQVYAGSEALPEHVQRAADFNGDGASDNRDLVLIAQSVA